MGWRIIRPKKGDRVRVRQTYRLSVVEHHRKHGVWMYFDKDRDVVVKHLEARVHWVKRNGHYQIETTTGVRYMVSPDGVVDDGRVRGLARVVGLLPDEETHAHCGGGR